MPLNPKTIQRNFVIVQENQPSSPFQGQIWVRTSDGATFQYFNGQWKQIGEEPDGIWIVENPDGKLTVDEQKLKEKINKQALGFDLVF